MTWYPLPQSADSLSAGSEFFENQSLGWSLWSFDSSDDQNAAGARSDQPEKGAAWSGEEAEGPAPLQLQFTPGAQDIFLAQFSDEERRRVDAPFDAADAFPDAMRRLLSYEKMLSAVLTGCSEDQDARPDHDTMDTMNSSEMLPDPPSDCQAGTGMGKRSRSSTDAKSAPGVEVLVLEELEDVVFQLTKKTRLCFRDAFYRLAESSRAKCSSANEASTQVGSGSGSQSFELPEGDAASREWTTPGCPERETNTIDRTVADLTLKPPCSAPFHQRYGDCFAGDSEAEITGV